MGHLSIPLIVIAIITLILSFNLNDVDTGTKKFNIKEVGQVFKNPNIADLPFLYFFYFDDTPCE